MNCSTKLSNASSHPRRCAFICGLFFLFAFCGAGKVMAQGGGKAEPNRIEFKRGTNSTTMNGVVHGDEQAEYILSARQGQRLIKLTATPAKSSCFDLQGPDGVDVGLEYDCNLNYSKVLPSTGDYMLVVSRPSQAKGTSRYKMTVTIR
jgi:hypothetical protein